MVTCLATSVWAKSPKMKMTTDIPESITMPDKVETRLGTLRFFDGFPDEATAQKVYDNLGFQRGVQAVLATIQDASMQGMRRGIREFGPDNKIVLISEELMDSKALFLCRESSIVSDTCAG